MNDLQIFSYESKQIRTVLINNEPWWVAKDVCSILGFVNDSDALTRHCKGVVNRYPLQTSGGTQDVRIIMPDKTEPYQPFIDKGYFEMKEHIYEDKEGGKHITFTPLVTGKGQIYIEKKWRQQHGRA